jgi:hypothetical protein
MTDEMLATYRSTTVQVGRSRPKNAIGCPTPQIPPGQTRGFRSRALAPESFWQPVQLFIKFDIFGSFCDCQLSGGRTKRFFSGRETPMSGIEVNGGDIKWQRFCWGKVLGQGGVAGGRIWRRCSRRAGSGLGDAPGPPRPAETGGAGRRIFLLGRGRGWLRGRWLWTYACEAKRRYGFARWQALGWISSPKRWRDGRRCDGRDEVFHRHHHRDDRDLSGNAASGHFGAEVGDFPEAV